MRQVLLYLHIGGAILLVGEILFASLWLRASLGRPPNPALARYVISTMRRTSRGIALPAFLVNASTGLILTWLGAIRWNAVWILLAVVLYIAMAALWHGRLIPLRRGMERLLDEADPETLPEGYFDLARRWIGISVPVLALFAAILVLMIWRPVS